MIERIPRTGTGIFAYDEQGRVLLSSRLVPYGYGFLSLPGGGQEWGELLEACVCRELYEETNLIIDVTSLRQIGITEEITDDSHWVTVYFFGLIINSQSLIRKEPHKHGEWKFYETPFTPAVSSLIWPPTLEILNQEAGQNLMKSLQIRSVRHPV